MTADTLLLVAAVAAIASVGALRLAWSLPRRSVAWNAMGWGLMAVAGVAGGWHSGAWGISIATLAGMAAAIACLSHAVLSASTQTAARASNRRAGMLPEDSGPLHLGRRMMTFLLVIIAAMLVSTAVAVPARSLSLIAGAAEADANVIALIAMPLVWAALAFALLMKETRGGQYRILLIWAAIGAIGIGLEFIL